jgi:hypothetical protein
LKIRVSAVQFRPRAPPPNLATEIIGFFRLII